jgi:hypothetical protein
MQTNIDTPQRLNIWKDEMTGSETDYPAGQIDKREKLSRKEFLHEYVLKNRPAAAERCGAGFEGAFEMDPQFF